MRKGGALMLCLILLGIASMTLFFILDSIVVQAALLRNRELNIQEEFNSKIQHAEIKLVKSSYIPHILDIIPTTIRTSQIINSFQVEGSDGIKTTGVLTIPKNYNELIYECALTREDNSGSTILKGRLINDFFSDDLIMNRIPHLNYNRVAIDKLPKFMEFFDNIPGSLDFDHRVYDGQIIHIKDDKKIRITGGATTVSLKATIDDVTNSINRNTSIFIESPNGIRNDLVLDIKNTSSSRLGGVIYIENGDLIIRNTCYINSVIILGNGQIIIDGPYTPTITGLVITNDSNDYSSKLAMEYSGEIIIKHGILAPGLIDPSIDSMEYRH